MRRRNHVWQANQVRSRFGFIREDIQPGACHLAGLQSRDEGFLGHQLASRGIDERGAILHFCDRSRIDDLSRGRRERRMERNDVRLGKQLIEGNQPDVVIPRNCVRDVGIVDQGLHLEALGALYDFRSDLSVSHYSQNLSLQLDSHEALAIPLSLLDGLVGLRDFSHQSQQQPHSMLCRADAVSFGSIHHDDPSPRRFGHIDIIHACSRSPDHLELGRAVEQICGNLRLAADDQNIGFGHGGTGFFPIVVVMFLDLEPGLASQQLQACARNLLQDEYMDHCFCIASW